MELLRAKYAVEIDPAVQALLDGGARSGRGTEMTYRDISIHAVLRRMLPLALGFVLVAWQWPPGRAGCGA